MEIASSEHSPKAIVHQPSVEFKTSANNVNAMFSDNEKCTNNNQELQAGTGNLNQQMAIPVVTTTENLYSSTEGMNGIIICNVSLCILYMCKYYFGTFFFVINTYVFVHTFYLPSKQFIQ